MRNSTSSVKSCSILIRKQNNQQNQQILFETGGREMWKAPDYNRPLSFATGYIQFLGGDTRRRSS